MNNVQTDTFTQTGLYAEKNPSTGNKTTTESFKCKEHRVEGIGGAACHYWVTSLLVDLHISQALERQAMKRLVAFVQNYKEEIKNTHSRKNGWEPNSRVSLCM